MTISYQTYDEAGVPSRLLGRNYTTWRMHELRTILNHYGVSTPSERPKIDLMMGLQCVINHFQISESDDLPNKAWSGDLPSPRHPRLNTTLLEFLGGRYVTIPQNGIVAASLAAPVAATIPPMGVSPASAPSKKSPSKSRLSMAHPPFQSTFLPAVKKRKRKRRYLPKPPTKRWRLTAPSRPSISADSPTRTQTNMQRLAPHSATSTTAGIATLGNPILQRPISLSSLPTNADFTLEGQTSVQRSGALAEKPTPLTTVAVQTSPSQPPAPTSPPLGYAEQANSISPSAAPLASTSPETSLTRAKNLICTVCFEDIRPESVLDGKITSKCDHEMNICSACLSQSIATQYTSKMWNQIDRPICRKRLEFSDVDRFADLQIRKGSVLSMIPNLVALRHH